MLVQFSVGNFRSFKDVVTLDLTAANLVSKNKAIDENNTFEAPGGLRLLKSVVLYGANASGKSNLLKALEFMKTFVNDSAKESQAGDLIKTEPFLLDSETENEPSFFEIIFILGKVRYRYGFEVTTNEVISEWLYHTPNKKESYLFSRNAKTIKLSRNFSEGRGLQKRTRNNALFLSVVSQFNGDIASGITAFLHNVVFFLPSSEKIYQILSTSYLVGTPSIKEEMVNLIRKFDLGIYDIQLIENKKVLTTHKKLDENGRVKDILFDMRIHESDGTNRLFTLSGVLAGILKIGNALTIDEIDARFHPLITKAIVELFHSKKDNPKNAQLIFATHDVNLLQNDRFRRDQIWFVEKDKYGASHLYSLADFKVRNDASYQKDYLQGRYGAIPFIGAKDFMKGWSNGKKEARKAS
jgi:uncharacterized protein